jgi:hypothetical protein
MDGGYSGTDNWGSQTLNDWNVSGAANAPLGGSNFSVQVDGTYHGFNVNHFSFHYDQGDVSLVWNHPKGKLGATAGTNEFGGGGGSFDFQNYGAFGVFYPGSQWTVGLKGGEFTCSHCGSLTYWGGEVIGYPTPDLALSLKADTYGSHGSNTNVWGVGGEWQPTARPWTVRAGYDRTHFDGIGVNFNTYSVGFRWYFGGGSNLVQHHREGAETWGAHQTAFQLSL